MKKKISIILAMLIMIVLIVTSSIGVVKATSENVEEIIETPTPQVEVTPSPSPEVTPSVEPTELPDVEESPKVEEEETPDVETTPTEENIEDEGLTSSQEETEEVVEEETPVDESKGDEYISEDDLLYSTKYLVTENTIERIMPKTSISDFIANLQISEGNTIEIYSGETVVTSGYIGTGMQIKGSNGKVYDISVVGDLTGDGLANQIEVTKIIRHTLPVSGWNLEGAYLLSADIDGNGSVNILDITKLINYIVFGRWEQTNIVNPNAPTIKVLSEKAENEEYYIEKVEFQVIEDTSTQNSKTTYKITGSKTVAETTIGANETITIEGEGIYLITAYTYGARGNRSKGSNQIVRIGKAAPEIVKNTVTYDAETNGGTTDAEAQEVAYGTVIDLTTIEATKEGYEFVGWSEEANAPTRIINSITVTSDITLYAIYRKEITIGFEYLTSKNSTAEQLENVEIYNKETTATMEAIELPTEITGYIFLGWTKETAAKPEILIQPGEEIEVTDGIKYTATYSYEVSVSFNTNGETIIPAETGIAYTNCGEETIGATIAIPECTYTKEGYAFVGWNTKISGEGTTYEAGEEYTFEQDTVLYAQWEANEYTITLNNLGATKEGTTEVYEKYNTGVYLDSEYTKQMTTSENSITIPEKEYKITYNANGGTLNKTEDIVTYTFKGYYATPGGSGQMIDANGYITSSYAAKYTSNTILYALWSEEVPVMLPTPTKEGYEFVGWSEDPNATTGTNSITVTSDVTLYAIYSKEVTATFNYYNGESTTVTAIIYNTEEGTTITAPGELEVPEGYTFRGWSTDTSADAVIEVGTEETDISLSKDTTYYASYQMEVEVTYYYYADGKSTATASGTRYMSYTGAIKNTDIEIPIVVTSNDSYEGIATSWSSYTPTRSTTEYTTYYAFGKGYITYYYYNGNENTSTDCEFFSYFDKNLKPNGTIVGEPIPSAYDGATFVDWSLSDSSIILSGTYDGKYAYYQKDITVTFDNTNGTNTKTGTKTYINNSTGGVNTLNPSITMPQCTYVQDGYTFIGWNTKISGEGTTYEAGEEYTFEQDTVLYAQWEANEYTVTLNNLGATKEGTTEVYEKYNTGVYLDSEYTKQMTTSENSITIPKKEHTITYNANGGILNKTEDIITYTFKGYYATPGGSGQMIDANGYITSSYAAKHTSNTTLYALWSEDVPLMLPTPTKEGYEFVGWSEDPNATTGTNSITVTSDVTLYAIYSKEVIATFNYYNGESTTVSGTILNNEEGTTINAPSELEVPEGYTFRGWSTDTSADAITLEEIRLSANKEYYASYEGEVTITLETNGGDALENLTGTVQMNYLGEKIGETLELPTPTKSAATFDGWYADETFENEIEVRTYAPTEDATIYAKWIYEVYAALYSDGTLMFSSTEENLPTEGLTASYGNIGETNYTSASAVPWFSARSSISTVDIVDEIKPTSTAYWFYGCSSLTQLDVSKLNTSSVTNMRNMFYNCSGLTTLDLSNFDTNNVTDMGGMFYKCKSLIELDVSGFDTSNVTSMGDLNSMGMFDGCSSLTKLDISGFNTGNVTSMYSMFFDCSSLIELDVSNFDTSNVRNMVYIFRGCKNLIELDISGFDTSSVIGMFGMFWNCSNLTELDVSKFNTSNVTNMGGMFYGCKKLQTLNLSGFNTSNVTDMDDMFNGCSGLTTLDLSSFDTSKVTDMNQMFINCNNLTGLEVSEFNTSNVKDMAGMFYNCNKLTTLNVSGFDTSKVTNMGAMFKFCENLTELNLSSFDTSKVTDMQMMFSGCSSLTELDVSNFNTSNVIDMYQMFWDCSNLTELDVNNFNTSNVKDMAGMFYNCSKLTTLNVSGFNTTKVIDMEAMFRFCETLTELDLSDFNTSNVTNMNQMFSSCLRLECIYVGDNWTTENADATDMFNGCKAQEVTLKQ